VVKTKGAENFGYSLFVFYSHRSPTLATEMDHLPDELIRAVFCEAVTLPKTVLYHDRSYFLEANETLAAQSYLLAAVSHRWREICLTTAELWTYIPLSKRNDWRSLTFIERNLARSRDQPLTIVLDVMDGPDRHLASTLKLLVEHASRWLRVHIKLDNECPIIQKIQLMQACASCSMPMLEELIIEHGRSDRQLAVYESTQLPECPRLVRLTNHLGILTPATTLNALRYLSLSIRDTNEAHLWATLSMTPTLQYLDVYFAEDVDELDQASLAPEHDIHLPLLTSFAVIGNPRMGTPWAERLHIPNLKTLTLSVESCHRLGTLYQTLWSPNLHLILMSMSSGNCGTLYIADVEELRSLRGVSTLEIFGFTSTLSDNGFFHALMADARQDGTCWAARFTQLVLRDSDFDTEMIREVALFVRMRASAAAADKDAPRLEVQWIACSHEEDEVGPNWLSDRWIY